MAEFKFLPLAKIKANQQNPRIISESKLKKLINSLLVFPKMMELRPITIDENNFVLGGNMRPQSGQNLYKMFEGVVTPDGKDENGDLIYVYKPERTI